MRLLDHLNVIGLRRVDRALPGLGMTRGHGQDRYARPRTSAMHASISKTFERDGQTWVAFSIATWPSLKAAQTLC